MKVIMASGESIEFTIFVLKFPQILWRVFFRSISSAIGQVKTRLNKKLAHKCYLEIYILTL